MSQLTFIDASPTFADIADSDIAANNALTDDAIQKISKNAKFGAVRPEVIFMGFYKHGDTVPTPVSPVDNYAYSTAETLFNCTLYSTRAPNTASGEIAAAVVHSGSGGTGYAVGDIIGVTQTNAANGILQVAAVSSGVVTALTVMQGGNNYTAVSNLATSGGSGTGLRVDITSIGLVFFSGQSSPPPLAISQPGNLLYFIVDINSSGVVSITISYLKGSSEVGPQNDGIVKVYAICQRNASLAIGTAPTYLDIPDDIEATGQPIKVGNASGKFGIQDLSHNAKFSTVRCEVIYQGFYGGRQTIPVPTSPVDGYVYKRGEVRYKFVPYTTLAPAGGFTNGTTTPPSLGSGTLSKKTNKGPLYWWKWDIDDTTGITSTGVSYYIDGGAENIYDGTAPNNEADGILKVYAICQRNSVNSVVLGVGGSVSHPGPAFGSSPAFPGSTDTGIPTAPDIAIINAKNIFNTNLYTWLILVNKPGGAVNWDSISQISVQVTTDPTFVSFPVGNSLDGTASGGGFYTGSGLISKDVIFSTNTPGEYNIRAKVHNGFGDSTYSITETRSTKYEDGIVAETSIPTPPSNLVVTKNPTLSALGTNAFNVTFLLPDGFPSIYGYSIYVGTTNTLPTATTQYSSFAHAGVSGALAAGSNVLTVAGSPAFTPGAWVGKDLVAFSNYRNVPPSHDYEGLLFSLRITANTTSTITFDLAAGLQIWTLSNIHFYIVNENAGDHFWDKFIDVTPLELDESALSATDDSSRTRTRLYFTDAPDVYVWVAVYNLLGQGQVQLVPAHLNFAGAVGSSLTRVRVAGTNSGTTKTRNLLFGTPSDPNDLLVPGYVLVGLASTDNVGGGVVSKGPLTVATAELNASIGALAAVAGSYIALSSGKTGSGTILPMAFFVNTERARIETSGRLLVGLTSSDVSGGATVMLGAIQSVTAATNASVGSIAAVAGSFVAIASGKTASGTYLPMMFEVATVESFRIEASGDVGRILIGMTSSDVSGGSIVAASAIQVASATTNASIVAMTVAGGGARISSGKTGSGTLLPFIVNTNTHDSFKVDAAASTATMTSIFVYVNSTLVQVQTFNDGLGHLVLYV